MWSVCRRHQDFLKLHACLQKRFPALALPRLPQPPSGAGVLDPATLESTRAGLRSYVTAIVADVPVAWGVEEFVMFLDSAEKGRRLFGNTRKKILTCEWDFHEGSGGATDSKRVAIGASWFDRSRGGSVEATPSCRSGRR